MALLQRSGGGSQNVVWRTMLELLWVLTRVLRIESEFPMSEEKRVASTHPHPYWEPSPKQKQFWLFQYGKRERERAFTQEMAGTEKFHPFLSGWHWVSKDWLTRFQGALDEVPFAGSMPHTQLAPSSRCYT